MLKTVWEVVEDSLDLIVKDSFDTQDDEYFLDSQDEGYSIVSKKVQDCMHLEIVNDYVVKTLYFQK